MLKKIAEYSSVLTFLGFIIHYTYLWRYYSSFDIDILQYAEFNEVLTSIASWLIAPIILSGAVIILLLPNIEINNGLLKLNFERKNKYLRAVIFIVLIVLFLIRIFVGRFDSGTFLENTISNFCNFLLFSLAAYLLVIMLANRLIGKSIKSPLAYIIILAIILITGLLTFGTGQANTVKKTRGLGKSLSFKYHGATVKTDSTIRFIGETRSTIFLFNTLYQTTTVYKKENVDSLVIRNY